MTYDKPVINCDLNKVIIWLDLNVTNYVTIDDCDGKAALLSDLREAFSNIRITRGDE
jgi:hypothetical protein